ncbi:hypothetical protein DFH06DRAFT_1350703 [Mycena polygramma]|nr:hypothetical protein DFH06DRAFT_1350703 [Mycena polygramma]
MADAELDAVRTFLPPRTVHELAQIPASLQILLPPYLLRVPLISAFTHPSYGVRAYFFDVVGPYARVINKGFPSRSSQPVDISPETRDFMLPHVGNLLKYLSIGYVIALESALNAATPLFVPPEAIRTLSLMQKFHMLLGHPSYGTGSGYEGVLLDMVNRMLKCARDSRSKTSDPIDIPYSSVMGHIPCVPSWTPEFIRVLEAQEIADPWIAERYWLRERVQDCDRVGKDLADLLADVAGGEWYPEVQF